MDRLTTLEVFVRVVECGSFAAAAKALDLSPAMVARHVQRIEAGLGTRVLHRTTRRQSLTDVGRLYLERAKAVLAEYASAQASAGELLAAPRGLLRVTAPVVLGSRGLAPLLPAFLAKYPEVQVELTLLDRVVDLMEEGFDVALRSGTPADPHVVARPLQPLRMVLCAAPGYLRRQGTPRTPADLASHHCLGFSHWAHKDRWRLIGQRGEEEAARVRSVLTINNGEALRQAALAGGGILMQWDVLVAEDLKARRLVRVLPRHAPPERPAHLLYLPERRPTPRRQRFVEHVLKHLGRRA